MIALYQRLSPRCHTTNQLNRLLIALENRMTPTELLELHQALSSQHNANTPPATNQAQANPPTGQQTSINEMERNALGYQWVHSLSQKLMYVPSNFAARFTRRKLCNGIYIFSGSGQNESKTVLVCFSGNEQRMMMPMPLFLQHIDPALTDIVYLRTVKGQGYRNGILGLAPNLETSFQELSAILSRMHYRSIAIMGVSAGGLPAILAGLQLGANAVLSVAAGNPNDEKWRDLSDGQGSTKLFHRFSKHSPQSHPEIFLVHGEQYPEDALANASIAACIKTKDTISVVNAGHNALYPLVQQRLFAELLRLTVFIPSHKE